MATSRPVGSVTTAASARQVRTSASAPRLECSSSTTAATINSPCLEAACLHQLRAAPSIAATPPFMSCDPRPYRRPLRTSGSNGRAMPATPTVSVCPHSINARPGRAPAQDADDVGPSGRRLGDVDLEAERPHLLGQPPRDGEFPRGPGHERRIHRVDGHEVAQQLTEGVGRNGHAGCSTTQASAARRKRMNSQPSSLGPVTAVAEAVRAAGGRALVVGGWVRDRLLGRESKDLDIEVFGLPGAVLHDVLGRLGRVEPVGSSFPVYKVAGLGDGAIDVALPRRESKAGRGHSGFAVEGDPSMSIADAARRRDFTVNAIAWDPLTGAYEDPFDGRADLARRVLRAVDP